MKQGTKHCLLLLVPVSMEVQEAFSQSFEWAFSRTSFSGATQGDSRSLPYLLITQRRTLHVSHLEVTNMQYISNNHEPQ